MCQGSVLLQPPERRVVLLTRRAKSKQTNWIAFSYAITTITTTIEGKATFSHSGLACFSAPSFYDSVVFFVGQPTIPSAVPTESGGVVGSQKRS